MGRPVPKEEVRPLLETLPDEASYEDIQYHIYIQQKGLASPHFRSLLLRRLELRDRVLERR